MKLLVMIDYDHIIAYSPGVFKGFPNFFEKIRKYLAFVRGLC